MKLPKLDLRIPLPAKWYDAVYNFLTGAQLEAIQPKNKRPLLIFAVEAVIAGVVIIYALYTWAVEFGWTRELASFLSVNCLRIGTCSFPELYGGFSLLVIVFALSITLMGLQAYTIIRTVIANRKAKKENLNGNPPE